MNSFVSGCTNTLHSALKEAIKVKGQKVRDNQAALLTEALSDAQAVSQVGMTMLKTAFHLAPEPAGKSIVSVLMLLAASPVIWSLVAENRKDRKDYRILKSILKAYEQNHDPEILKATQLFVKLHSVPEEGAPRLNIKEVHLVYNKIPAPILDLMNNAKLQAEIDEDAKTGVSLSGCSKFMLRTVFNAFSLSVRSCTVEAGKTFRTIRGGLKDVKKIAAGDLRSIWKRAHGETLLESKKRLLHDLKGAPYTDSQILKSLFAPHMDLAESIHPLQDDLRNNARMRLITGVGIVACSSFISLALINAGIAVAVGAAGTAAAYIGLSVLLSIPPLRVLCERQQELVRTDEDRTLQILERLQPQ